MTLNLATLNARGLRDPTKCSRLLGELSNPSVDFAAVQEIHFTCDVDCQVLEDDYVVLSAHGSRSSVRISLLIGRSLNADVNLVLVDDGAQLVVTDVVISFEIGWPRFMRLISLKRGFLFFSAVSVVPRRSETDSFSGWLECDPWSQGRQGRNGSKWVGKERKQPDQLDGPSWLGQQVSSGSPKAGDVDVAR